MNAISTTEPALTLTQGDTAQPRLADAVVVARSLRNRSEKRRRDLVSSLHAIAKIVGKPPEAIILDPPTLSAAITGQAARVYGLNPKRYRNVLTDLRCVLREMAILSPRPTRAALSGPWAAVFQAAETQWDRYRLTSFAAFCDGRSIMPAQAGEAVVDDYIAHQRQSDITPKAMNRATDAIRALNRVAALRPDLGLRQLTLRRKCNQYRLPDADFTTAFIADLDAWCMSASRGDPADVFADLDDQGEEAILSEAPPRRQSTIALRRAQILQAASALVLTGKPVSTIRSLRDLVEPFDTVKVIAKYHYGRRAGEVTQGVFGILEILRQIAKYHVCLDKGAIGKITALRNRVKPKREGIAPRNSVRLKELQDDRQRAALLHLPAELLRQAEKAKKACTRSRLAACAAALEILIVCPLRVTNLVQLRLDRHVRRAMNGRGQFTHLVIPAKEVKNASSIDWPVPPASLPILDAWIKTYRPEMAGPDPPWMFPGRGSDCRHVSSMRKMLEEEIARCTGILIHPHLMRHFAAALYLRHNPGQFESVRRVLGHRSLQTTVDSYLPMESDTAARRFDNVVMKERAATKLLAHSSLRGRPALKAQQGKVSSPAIRVDRRASTSTSNGV